MALDAQLLRKSFETVIERQPMMPPAPPSSRSALA
jgi:hypothetical protein